MPDIQEQQRDGEEINLRHLFSKLLSGWKIFAVSLIVLTVLGFAYMKMALPVYEAETSILLKDNKYGQHSNIEDFLDADIFNTQRNISSEMGILQSRTVVYDAATHVHMDVSCFGINTFRRQPLYRPCPFRVEYEWIHNSFFNNSFFLRMKNDGTFDLKIENDITDYEYNKNHRFGEKIATPYFTLRVLRNDSTEFSKEYNSYEFIIHSPQSLLVRIKNNLNVAPLNKDASIIRATYRDNVKQRAIEFLDALSEEYINRDIRDKSSVATLTLKFIDDQLTDISKELNNIETELQQFKEHNKTVDLSEESKNYLSRLSSIDNDRAKAEIDLRSLDYLYNYVTSNKDAGNFSPSTLGTPDPVLVQLVTQLQTLQSRRRNLAFGATENSPAIKIIDAQIADAKNLLIENINNIRQQITVSLKSMNQQLGGYEAGIRKIPSVERELLGIQRGFDVNQNIYLYLLQKKSETSIARATVVSDNKVLDTASASDIPVKPKLKMVMMICLLLGFILPTIFILLRDFIQNKITSREEIEKLTKIPVLGIVGHMSEGGERLVVHHKPKSSIAEAFRSIRTNLIFFGMSEKNNVILITSSVGGEGKSFTAINLASVLALQNNRVIIVALDLRKSQLNIDFGIDNGKGVSTYLSGQSSMDEIIHTTKVTNLDFISSGPVPPNPAELISKPECGRLIAELKHRYDYVIIDTPPIGIVADALLIMKHSDINIFILRQNYSRKENLKVLNEYQRKDALKNVSILFNDAGRSHTYGYGYYDDEKQKRKLSDRIFAKA
jgi:capsular exopolysaccharide synthesis family protein